VVDPLLNMMLLLDLLSAEKEDDRGRFFNNFDEEQFRDMRFSVFDTRQCLVSIYSQFDCLSN